MPFFDQYPYTNFHNINLDWVLQRVKEWGELVEQNNTAFHNLEEANENFKTYVTTYLENLDVQEEINNKLDSLLATGDLQIYLQPYISEDVSNWLEENITAPETVVIDSSLTVAGACADSEATGNAITNIKNDLSCFDALNGADRFIKNVRIQGDFANRLISNFRNNFITGGQAQSGFVIYFTNESGDEAPTQLVAVNDSLQGHFYRKLADGRTYEFDYDVSSIPSGQRVTSIGLPYKFKNSCFIPPNYINFGMGAFDSFGVIGDSYASGEIYTIGNDNQYHGYDYYYLSWGSIIARIYGNTCYNFSKGGLTTRSWLTNSKGLPLLRNTTPQPLYICALGANDISKLGESYIGTIEDIDISNPALNSDTFYGNYGKIISYILQHSPKAKIFIMTVAYRYNATERLYNNAIKQIGRFFNIPIIDLAFDSFFTEESVYNTKRVQSHPTAVIYAGMAQAIIRLIDDSIYKNIDYFADYTPITE